MGAEPDPWLEACRRAARGIEAHLAARPGHDDRTGETGTVGEGGDHTLDIDAAAEAIVFTELERLHDEHGLRFRALSEERGEVDFGGGDRLVVVDPIDGSLNAKRGLPHHCLSIAVAEGGTTLADVVFGFVHDFGPDEEWEARRGHGARRNGRTLDPAAGERCSHDGKLEVLGIESADPRWVAQFADALCERAYRLRALGAIATTLCQVAGARLDAMITLKGCRAVDSAAGQLIVREGGGLVAACGYDDPLGAPLDLEPHAPLVAARSQATLDALCALHLGRT